MKTQRPFLNIALLVIAAVLSSSIGPSVDAKDKKMLKKAAGRYQGVINATTNALTFPLSGEGAMKLPKKKGTSRGTFATAAGTVQWVATVTNIKCTKRKVIYTGVSTLTLGEDEVTGPFRAKAKRSGRDWKVGVPVNLSGTVMSNPVTLNGKFEGTK